MSEDNISAMSKNYLIKLFKHLKSEDNISAMSKNYLIKLFQHLHVRR